jgi:hypothetical protein
MIQRIAGSSLSRRHWGRPGLRTFVMAIGLGTVPPRVGRFA